MPLVLPEPELLAAYQTRSGSRVGWEYQVKDGYVPTAIDVVADEGEIETNDTDMSIRWPFAAAQGRDRVGDFFNLAGMDVSNHERNPLTFLDHARWMKWPVGLDQSPETKRYTVEVDLERGLATATVFIKPIIREQEQVYEFYKAGLLRSGSVGYRTKKETFLPADPVEGVPRGKNLQETELLETSLVFLPMNQDCVRRMYDGTWSGKSLADAFRAQLEPVRPRKKAVANGWRPDEDGVILTVQVREKSMGSTAKAKAMKTAPSPSPAMSTTDDSAGGALVPPPGGKKDGDELDEPVEQEYEEEPVSHNAQRMASVHHLFTAVKECLEQDPHLIDHPEVKKFLYEVIGPKSEELRGMVSEKFKETHPDYEPLEGGEEGEKSEEGDEPLKEEEEMEEGKKPEEKVPGEINEDEPPADVPHEEETEEEEEEGTPAKAWTGPKVRRKSASVNGKSGVPTKGTKSMNQTQRKMLGDCKDYMEACAQHTDMPHIFRAGHSYHAQKMADMLDMGTKDVEEETRDHMDEVDTPGEEEVKSLLTLSIKAIGEKLDRRMNMQDQNLAAMRVS